MKYLASILLTLFIAINVSAQHCFSFMGIPIKGDIDLFGERICSKGFSEGLSSIKISGVSLFKGKFTGRDATVTVFYTPEDNNIYGLIAMFDESDNWDALVEDFNYYSKLINIKYGDTPYIFKRVPQIDNDSNDTMLSLLYNKDIEYETFWHVEDCFIILSITSSNDGRKAQIMISYGSENDLYERLSKDHNDF